jgi:hypothetical protein
MVCAFSGDGKWAVLTSATTFRIRGCCLYDENERQPAAIHKNGCWQFRSIPYATASVGGPLLIELFPVEAALGSTTRTAPAAWFANGVLHAPTGPIVFFDEEMSTWCERQRSVCYSEIILARIASSPETWPNIAA